jgi:hypothetical protein
VLRFFKPENDFEVRKALLSAGRQDPIGSGCDDLIPAHPPKAALHARMSDARRDLAEAKYVHSLEKPDVAEPRRPDHQGRAGAGYRPLRKTARRRPR